MLAYYTHIQEGHLNLVEFLVEKGADVDVNASANWPLPLWLASQVCLLSFNS